jgi:flagellar hook-length control protein FliK
LEVLNGFNQPLAARIDFTELNFKEIHVKTAKESAAPVGAEETLISNANMLIKSKVNRNSHSLLNQIFEDAAVSAPSVLKIGDAKESDIDLTQSYAKSPIDSIAKNNDTKEQAPIAGSEPDATPEDVTKPVPAKFEQNAIWDTKNVGGKELDKQITVESKVHQPVRIVLPENTKLNSGRQNHTIMIKIEPEHLGPARLELHLKNEIVTAKLTVETSAAKTTLESSINSLKEQFAKADIKVEQIEINVRGETNNNQLFERQPQWQRFNSARHIRFNENELLEQFVPVGQINSFRQLQYVGNDGVNILA